MDCRSALLSSSTLQRQRIRSTESPSWPLENVPAHLALFVFTSGCDAASSGGHSHGHNHGHGDDEEEEEDYPVSYEYYIKIVPTTFEYQDGSLEHSYQFVANSNEIAGQYRLPGICRLDYLAYVCGQPFISDTICHLSRCDSSTSARPFLTF